MHSLIEQYALYITELIEEERLQDISVVTEEVFQDMLDRLFLFTTIWAYGSSLDESKKTEFSDILKLTFKKLMSTMPGFYTDF